MVCMEIQGHNQKLMKCCSSYSWVNLPPELLTTILDRLDISSSIRLAAVCTSLAATIRTCLPAILPYRPDKPIPWLLLSAKKSKTGPNRTILTFYDLPTSTSYSVPTPIPSLDTHRWLSSKKGWLLTCDPQSRLHLIKPLTGAHILLPSKGIETKLRHRVTLCHTPDCACGFLVVGLIQHRALVFMKAGDKRWTTINASQKRSYEDVVVYQEKLYALTSKSLCCWDLVDIGFSFKGETQISQVSLSNRNTCWLRQLVEWRGELLMLSMHKDQTSQVKLHKLSLRDPAHSHLLSPVQSIGDDALFIGTNYSFVVQTSGLNNVQGNCIYFTSDVCQSYYGAEEFHSKCAFRVFDRGQETYMPRSPPGSPVHLPLPICWFQPR